MRRRLLPLAAVLVLAGCGGDETTSSLESRAESGVEDLTNVLDLRSDFEANGGSTRVVLLLSPT